MRVRREAGDESSLRRHHSTLRDHYRAGRSRSVLEPILLSLEQLLLQFQRVGGDRITRTRLPKREHFIRNLHQNRVLIALTTDVALLQLQLLDTVIGLRRTWPSAFP